MYLRTKNEVSKSKLSKVRAQTEQTVTHTDATEHITTPHSLVVLTIVTNLVRRALSAVIAETEAPAVVKWAPLVSYG